METRTQKHKYRSSTQVHDQVQLPQQRLFLARMIRRSQLRSCGSIDRPIRNEVINTETKEEENTVHGQMCLRPEPFACLTAFCLSPLSRRKGIRVLRFRDEGDRREGG